VITPQYKEILLALHSKYGWGFTAGKYAGDTVMELLKEYPEIKTILDYGCGEGSLKKWISDAGIADIEWTQYDPGVAEFSARPEGKFDLVITTDVMEHVEECMLNDVLDDLRGFTKRFLYNEIACYFSGAIFGDGVYKGQDLHINLKAPDMWKYRLQHNDFKNKESKVSLLEGWKVRYLNIQERK